MDELSDVTELKLDCGAHIVEANNLGKFMDDFKSPFDAAKMVVGKLQNEQILKNIIFNH
jgi:hypothetical protein